MPILELSFASKEDSLEVRHFLVREEISGLFEVDVVARSPLDEIDLEGIVGHGAGFALESGVAHLTTKSRIWTGICSQMELVQAEPTGLSTYALKIVPALWRTTLRRNHRIFQHLTIPDIVQKVLAEWQIVPELRLTEAYLPYEYRTQYGETDFAFVNRLLEEAGIAYFFTHDGPTSILVLSDQPTQGDARPPLPYVDNANQAAQREFITRVNLAQRVKPGRFTVRDFDFRNQLDYQLFAAARAATETAYERYDYEPGAFWFEPGQAGGTPVADDKGVARTNQNEGDRLAGRYLDGERRGRRALAYETSVVDLSPGTLFTVEPHPRQDIAGKTLLVTESSLEGGVGLAWTMLGHAVYADVVYRPERRTPRPRVQGVQSAVVVGPPGEEIYVDELGRVRVQFHWDREGRYDDDSALWIRVSQGWAGAGYGLLNLPRVGQEVLVDFFEGNPDRPVITGRVFSQTRRVLYKLPDEKTKSGWKTESSPGAGGFNELSFEDAAGREEIHVQAQKDFTEIVKNDQSSTVWNDRSASVTVDDSMTVGGSQSFTVGHDQSHTIAKFQANDVGDGRTSTIAEVDSIDAGNLITGTVGPGVGYVYRDDQNILFTNGVASIVLTPKGLFLDAKGDVTLHAGGTLKLSGKQVVIDGKSGVYFNLGSKACTEEWNAALAAMNDILEMDDPFARNKVISAQYAQMFLNNPELKWPGVAAFASKQVGCGMNQARDMRPTLTAAAGAGGTLTGIPGAGLVGGAAAYKASSDMIGFLAKGNGAVFQEIYPILELYEMHKKNGTLADLADCMTQLGPSNVPPLVAEGIKDILDGDTTEGALKMLQQEQQSTLQHAVYDSFEFDRLLDVNKRTGLAPINVSYSADCTAGPELTKTFSGGDLYNYDQRWPYAKGVATGFVDLSQQSPGYVDQQLQTIVSRGQR
jgi:type VI secretion system secreted protein VgrG